MSGDRNWRTLDPPRDMHRQCEEVNEDGARCVYGAGHTVRFHLWERPLLTADSFLTDAERLDLDCQPPHEEGA